MNKAEIIKAIAVLKRDGSCQESVEMLERICNTDSTEVELINRKDYFATVLWQKEDISSALEESNVPVTDENIQFVISEIKSQLEDTSDGTEAIYSVIEEMAQKNEVTLEVSSGFSEMVQGYLDSDNGEIYAHPNAPFVETLTADFGEGFEVDIKICFERETTYIDPVLFYNGSEVALMDPCYEILGDFEFSYGNKKFSVRIISEED